MNQATQKKLDRILEIRGEIEALEGELEELLAGARPSPKTVRGGGARQKRKYKKRKPKDEADEGVKDDPPATRPAEAPRTQRTGKPCCGTMGFRHKKGCPVAASKSDGRLPPDEDAGDEKSWKCLNCDNRQKAAEQPEECDKCPGTVFVEAPAWEA